MRGEPNTSQPPAPFDFHRPTVKRLLAIVLLCLPLAAMAQQPQLWINTGATNNDGTGDGLRAAFNKANTNFARLWTNVLTAGVTNLDLALVTTNGSLTNWVTWTPSTSSVVMVHATVYGATTNNGGVGIAGWGLTRLFKMNAAGTTLDATTNTVDWRTLDAFAGPWTAHLTNDSSTNIILAIAGSAGTNVAWRARIQAITRSLLP